MKFELVDFYPITDKNRGKSKKNLVGTVHLYIIDFKIDLRGIKVFRNKNRIFFLMPHQRVKDLEAGEMVSYPVFSFTNQKEAELMRDFLHHQVKPIILEKIKDQK